MKKLAFLFVAVAAISFASCGNGTKQAEVVEDTTAACVDTTAVVEDTTSQDTAAAEVAAEPVAEQQ
ncbi:MAG: hypothetical protein IJ762_01950 [Bacteroidaceae bacterium]|nr:hypothetical protein [Bacteroidaceae bacterium]MBR1787944.1 hypothetical protein [Bacteroidaceae bacterium]